MKWNDSTNTYDTFSYHCINIPSLVDKATRPIPPPATRATSTTPETVHINACHTGPQGNITAILQQGRLLPSILHFDANPGFFAQATRITHQSLHDNYEQARILHNAWKLAKNVHSIMVHLLAWGRGTKFTSGGEAHAMQLLQQGHGAVFHSNARCWVIHPHNAIVKGLAWSINATPPDLSDSTTYHQPTFFNLTATFQLLREAYLYVSHHLPNPAPQNLSFDFCQTNMIQRFPSPCTSLTFSTERQCLMLLFAFNLHA